MAGSTLLRRVLMAGYINNNEEESLSEYLNIWSKVVNKDTKEYID